MSRFPWFLLAIPVGTFLALAILVLNLEAFTEALGPFGEVGAIVVAFALVATDVWAMLFFSRQFQKQWREELQSRTGRSVEQWIELLSVEGPEEQKERVAWLRTRYGLDEMDAQRIVVEQIRREGDGQGGGPGQQLAVLGCILALFLLVAGAVFVTMMLVRAMR